MPFEKYSIEHPDNLFPLLYESVQWETFPKGRQIAILSKAKDDHIPLIRTTTVYQNPYQPFSAIHDTIVNKIRSVSGIKTLELNNAMAEVYDSRYTTMKFHTDQALDLDPESYICLFSCYEKGEDEHPRVLTVQIKETKKEFEVPLLHHSVVIFSTATNKNHLHKIEGKGFPKKYDNKWMGVTLRLSKSFVKFKEGIPYLVSGESEPRELTIATDKEQGNFYGYKGAENRGTDFEWPHIQYTISPSDRMPAVTTSN